MPGPEQQKTLPAPATGRTVPALLTAARIAELARAGQHEQAIEAATTALAAKDLSAEQQAALLELRAESRMAMRAQDLAAADARAMHALAHARQRRLPREQREAHLAGTVNLSETFERLVDAGLRLNEIRSASELHDFVIGEATELSGAERVLLVLESPEGLQIAGSLVPRGESAAALLQAITPWLEEARATRAVKLRHGPDGAEPIDQRSCLVAPLVAQGELQRGGGGGGGTVLKLSTSASLGARQSYVVGPSGAAGAAGTDTTISGLSLTAGGGGTGAASGNTVTLGAQAAGGTGGTASGGDLNIPGRPGMRGVIYDTTNGCGGAGGDSVFGKGGAQSGTAAGGNNGTAYGGGGGGCHTADDTNRTGGSGAAGVIYAIEFIA